MKGFTFFAFLVILGAALASGAPTFTRARRYQTAVHPQPELSQRDVGLRLGSDFGYYVDYEKGLNGAKDTKTTAAAHQASTDAHAQSGYDATIAKATTQKIDSLTTADATYTAVESAAKSQRDSAKDNAKSSFDLTQSSASMTFEETKSDSLLAFQAVEAKQNLIIDDNTRAMGSVATNVGLILKDYVCAADSDCAGAGFDYWNPILCASPKVLKCAANVSRCECA